MGGQSSKSQPTDESFTNHSSINFVSEETSMTAESTLKKEEEISISSDISSDKINLLGER